MDEQLVWQQMLAVVAVRALSPVVFVPAIAAGWFARAWWHGAIAAALIGLAHEAVFHPGLPGGAFLFGRAMLAAVAALFWVTIVITIRRGFSAWREGRDRLKNGE